MEQGIGYLDELVQYDEELSDSLAERFVKYGFKAPDPALARQLLMKLKAQVYYGLPEDGAASIQEYVAAIHKLAERMVFLLHVFLQGDDAQPEQLENLRAKLPADCQTLASRNREKAAKELEQLLAEEGIRIADLLAKPEEKAIRFHSVDISLPTILFTLVSLWCANPEKAILQEEEWPVLFSEILLSEPWL